MAAAYIEERRMRVAEGLVLRKTGAQMAAELGASEYTICHDIKAVKKRWQAMQPEIVDTAIAEDLQRLAALEAVQIGIALDPKNRMNGLATERVLAIMKRRAELLGLDAPVKAKILDYRIDVSTLTDAQLERIANGDDPFEVVRTGAHGAVSGAG